MDKFCRIFLLLIFPLTIYSTVSYLAINEFTKEIAQFETGEYGPPLLWKSIPSEKDSIWEIWHNDETHMNGYKKVSNPLPIVELFLVAGIILFLILIIKWLLSIFKRNRDNK